MIIYAVVELEQEIYKSDDGSTRYWGDCAPETILDYFLSEEDAINSVKNAGEKFSSRVAIEFDSEQRALIATSPSDLRYVYYVQNIEVN